MKKVKDLKVYEGMLIVVDMVNGFVKYGALHDEEIGKVVPRQIEIIKESLKNEDLIVFVNDTHEVSSVEHKRFGGALHCVRGTGEEEVIDELKEYVDKDNTLTVRKNSTSFMEAPKFRDIVQNAENIKEVKIVGCCTDICDFNGAMGLANYYDEWNRDVNIKVYEDAIATFGEDSRQNYVEAAKLLMEQQGIKLVKKR